MNERFKLDGGYIGNVNIHIAIDKIKCLINSLVVERLQCKL